MRPSCRAGRCHCSDISSQLQTPSFGYAALLHHTRMCQPPCCLLILSVKILLYLSILALLSKPFSYKTIDTFYLLYMTKFFTRFLYGLKILLLEISPLKLPTLFNKNEAKLLAIHQKNILLLFSNKNVWIYKHCQLFASKFPFKKFICRSRVKL